MSGSPSLYQSSLLEPRCVVACQKSTVSAVTGVGRVGVAIIAILLTVAVFRRVRVVSLCCASCRVFVSRRVLVSHSAFMYRDGVFVSCHLIVSRIRSSRRVLVACPGVWSSFHASSPSCSCCKSMSCLVSCPPVLALL